MSIFLHNRLQQFLIFNLLIPALFFGFAVWLMPIEQVFQFDPDEGIEVMKASLYSDGFSLYTQIWNDQPPFLTVLLSYWFDLFGKTIIAARLLILSFATLLVWSFCQTIRLFVGNVAAIFGTLLLVVSCNFLRLSVSVMFGLPALALAMVSIYTLMLYNQKSHHYLVIASGALLALSLQTKLFTIFLAPLLVFELFLCRDKEYSQKKPQSVFFPILLWLSSLLITFILTGLLFDSLHFEQLLKSHATQNIQNAFQGKNSFLEVLVLFLQDFDYLLLLVPGVIVLFSKKQWTKFPLLWLIAATLLLLNHQPAWYHHYLLISIPLTWLTTYGVTVSFSFFQQKRWYSQFKPRNLRKMSRSSFAAALVILTIAMIPIKLIVTQVQNYGFAKSSNSDTEIVNLLLNYKQSTQWVFTDIPMYAFYAGLNVPPEIAVFSTKRLELGNLTTEQLDSVLKTYQPRQIVLGRFPDVQRELSAYINQNYSKTYEGRSDIYNNNVITHYRLNQPEPL